MKNKIIGIWICILILAAAIPAGNSLHPTKVSKMGLNISQSCSDSDWLQLQKLLTSNGTTGDEFGYSIFVSGDTALIGATRCNSSKGAAYIFTQSGSGWTQQAKLTASDGETNDVFGVSVSLSGDTALIGAVGWNSLTGAVYVFTRSGSSWTQQAKLTASDGATYDYFGFSVSVSGDTALIGALFGASGKGTVYVFTRFGSSWTQQAKLTASDGETSDYFGVSVSVSGDTALIGAYGCNTRTGAAYVFTRSGSNWTQQAKLTASDGAQQDLFGHSVFMSGDTALIGATGYEDKGAAYMFTRSRSNWTQQAKLTASDGAENDNFGESVSVSGDTALIGAYYSNSTTGSAYVFTRSGSNWTQQAKLTASDGTEGDEFGFSVFVSGNTILIGAPHCNSYAGAVYVFINNQPPVFGSPTPSNGSMNNPLSLTWSIPISDPEGDMFSWTIQCSNGQTNTGTNDHNGTKTLGLSGLAPSTIFKVWVNATDPSGSGLFTIQWYTFTTKTNQPPNPPVIHGPASGKAKQAYDYTFNATDPNGEDVSYYIDWGDNTTSIWVGPYTSGIAITQSHTWKTKGTYTIKAKAKDVYGNESGWGTLSVTMPLSYQPPHFRFLVWLLERFPILRHILGFDDFYW